MTTISATTILRSRNISGSRPVLSSLLLRYPRSIHAELLTHRKLSKNAASSRAIPVSKLIDDVLADPARPLYWGKNQPGMQAREKLTGDDLENAKSHWDYAMSNMISYAENLASFGAHKQIVNRLLEPFSHITVLASATDWDGFLEQRDHPDAEPHIQMLAREIRSCLERTDNIQDLWPGEWHLPFVSEDDKVKIVEWLDLNHRPIEQAPYYHRKLSVARCASTSYKTVDGFDMTIGRAADGFEKLKSAKPPHASPFEHVACADKSQSRRGWENSAEHGNFIGWRQYRHYDGGSVFE